MRFKLLVLTAIVAIFSVGFITTGANAQDGITPYAWIDVFAGYVDKSKEYVGGADGDRDIVMQASTPGNTKFGLKGVKGNLTTVTEIGFATNNPSGATQWKDMFADLKMLDPGLKASLKFGRFSLPYATEGFNPIMDGIDSSAMAWEASGFDSYQLGLQFNVMGFYVALVNPVIDSSRTASKIDAMFPKFAVGYVMPMPMKIGAHFVAQQLKVDDAADAKDGETILSYQANVTANMFMSFGIIHATAWYSQNSRDMGIFVKTGTAPGMSLAQVDATDATKFANTTGFGGNVGVQINIGNISPNAGVGYESYDNDNWTKKDTNLFYFAGVAIMIDPTTTLYPGIKVNDYQKDGNEVKKGKIMWYGAEITARI